MTIESRDTLRASVIETLMSTFGGAKKVAGGVAYLSDVLDEETGKFFPVEIKVAVKNTADTARSEAYDLDKAAADFATKPGRRVADPEKAAANAAKKEAAAARKAKYLEVLHNWVATNKVEEMTVTEIQAAIPELAGETIMYVGGLVKALVEEGMLNVTIDDKRKKHYTK